MNHASHISSAKDELSCQGRNARWQVIIISQIYYPIKINISISTSTGSVTCSAPRCRLGKEERCLWNTTEINCYNSIPFDQWESINYCSPSFYTCQLCLGIWLLIIHTYDNMHAGQWQWANEYGQSAACPHWRDPIGATASIFLSAPKQTAIFAPAIINRYIIHEQPSLST